MWDFFEQPWTLLGAAVIVLLGVQTFRSVWPERQRWWQWLLPVGVGALGVGLDLGVATDLEKINAMIRTAMTAVEQEDCVTLSRLIGEDYEDSAHPSKQALVNRCRERLVPPAIERVRKIGIAIRITPPAATVILTMSVKLEEQSYWVRTYGKSAALVKAQFWLERLPDKKWLVRRIEVLEVDKMPASWGVTRDDSAGTNGPTHS